MILFGEESLRTAMHNFVAHYHTERNHQGLANRLISPAAGLLGNAGVVQRRPGIHRSRAAPSAATFISPVFASSTTRARFSVRWITRRIRALPIPLEFPSPQRF